MIMEIRASPPSWIIWTIEAIATTHKQGIVHQLNFYFLTFSVYALEKHLFDDGKNENHTLFHLFKDFSLFLFW